MEIHVLCEVAKGVFEVSVTKLALFKRNVNCAAPERARNCWQFSHGYAWPCCVSRPIGSLASKCVSTLVSRLFLKVRPLRLLEMSSLARLTLGSSRADITHQPDTGDCWGPRTALTFQRGKGE